MNRIAAILASALSLWLLASPAFAAETKSGTIKKVDGAARTITFRQERADKDEVLAVDKSVDLAGVKSDAKAQVTVDAGVVKEIKAVEAKAKAPGY